MKSLKWSGGDIYFSQATGKSTFVTDDDLLSQNIAYYLLAEPTLFTARSKADISQAINTAMTKLQIQQSSDVTLTTRETFQAIEKLNIVTDPNDPTYYFFYLVVQSAAGDTVAKLFSQAELTDLSQLLPENQ